MTLSSLRRATTVPATALAVLAGCSIAVEQSVQSNAYSKGKAGALYASSNDPRRAAIVPKISGPVKTKIKQIFNRGQQLSNERAVFAKVGDSITVSQAYLYGFACNEESLGRFSYLGPTIDFFQSKTFPAHYTSVWCERADSFSRDSIAAESGVTSEHPISKLGYPVEGCSTSTDTYLSCELKLLKPNFVFVMLGTNDISFHTGLSSYKRNLEQIVRASTRAGVIPILSTIPPRLDSTSLGRQVTRYNRVVLSVARRNRVPPINYWRALDRPGMVNKGMSSDGIHPNLLGNCEPECQGFVFSSEGLRYGFNQRNLITVKTLASLRKALAI